MEEAKIDHAAMGRLFKALVFICGPDDLRPKAPAFIRRVLFLHSALLMGWHARRAWSPQVAQARGAHLRACLLSGPSVA